MSNSKKSKKKYPKKKSGPPPPPRGNMAYPPDYGEGSMGVEFDEGYQTAFDVNSYPTFPTSLAHQGPHGGDDKVRPMFMGHQRCHVVHQQCQKKGFPNNQGFKPVTRPPSLVYRTSQAHISMDASRDMQMEMIQAALGDDEDWQNKNRRHRQYRRDDDEPSHSAPTASSSQDELKKENEELTKKMNELMLKVKEDVDLMPKLRKLYIHSICRSLQVNGTLDPTEGTVLPYDKYDESDPVTDLIDSKDEQSDSIAGTDWNSAHDCEYLHEAMKGTDEEAIIHVVTNRSNSQRQELVRLYEANYGEDLPKKLISALSGDVGKVITNLFMEPARYDAYNIKKAIHGQGTDEATLIEILMTRTNAQIAEIRNVYRDVAFPTKKTTPDVLDKDLEKNMSGHFKRLLVSAAQGGRCEMNPKNLDQAVEDVLIDGQPNGQFRFNFEKVVNLQKCKKEANILFEEGENKWETNEAEFIRIFSITDFYTLRVVYDEYVKISQRDILNSVAHETSGDFQKGLVAIVENIRCRPMFFAQKLAKAIVGLGTDEDTVTRIIVSRSEIDLMQIKKCYLEITKRRLWQDIKNDTSGDYRKVLLAIVGKN